MTNHYSNRRRLADRQAAALILYLISIFIALGTSARAQTTGKPKRPTAAVASDTTRLVIDTTTLPRTYRRADFTIRLQAHSGAPPVHWKVESGDLPPGLQLDDDGTLHGLPQRTGEYHFTISARDGSRPQQVVQREYVLNVVAAISMQWKLPARVSGNRIDGSVTVSNTTADDIDFTFVAMAVADNGRATAIGYQRFALKKGTTDFEIPFGETLPHGAYTVHVDGVGEIAEKNEIHRSRLDTPAALQVVAGP
ncbi:MAG TPA: putative Ig domain-containing protein [Candidatus Sulfotelmatobacter sp.]